MFRMFRLDPSNGVPPYLQIKDQIKTQIAMGHLKPGGELPRIRKLAKDLVVNPTTIVRAYRELEYEGLIASKQGSGVFVTEHSLALTDQAKADRVHDLFLRAVVEAVNLKLSPAMILSLFAAVMDEVETGGTARDGETAPLNEMSSFHLPEEGR